MSSINVLQKVTTFPIESMITFPDISPFCKTPSSEIHDYYSREINVTNSNKGPLNDDEIKSVKNMNNRNIIDLYKKRYIVYNTIYDKLFSNSLNVLEHTYENTLIIFPTMDQGDKGRYELNPTTINYYDDKYIKINSQINFNKKYCYVELKVFLSEKKEEYSKRLKTQFDDIKQMILTYNNNVAKQPQFSSSGSINILKPVKNILFIINSDKKGIFTGFYKKQLSKENQDMLYKEYTNFLNNAIFRKDKIDDNGINITFPDVVKKAKYFQTLNSKAISSEIISSLLFDKFIKQIKEYYKKNTDKEYKKSLDLNDNIEKLKIFYKIDNADKILDDDKIETGSNKLYYIYKDPKNPKLSVIGFFLLTSEERGIYRFKEDVGNYKIRIAAENVRQVAPTPSPISPQNTNGINFENENTNEKNSSENTNPEYKGTIHDFAVQIKNKYGINTYKCLDKTKLASNKQTDKNIHKGFIDKFKDKLEIKFKWFNFKDIDASLLNKDIIKYYSEILFDKKTLIEYLKTKQRYNDKTILSYEFLKINDSQELSEYCDFIHKNYKSNIIDTDTGFNPFKFNFDKRVIHKNILDIIFETNTPIYLRQSKQTKNEQRIASNDSYKIVQYKYFENKFQDDPSCKPLPPNTNTCQNDYDSGIEDSVGLKVIVTVTKTNIKDSDFLKTKTSCKTKKNNLIYNYKKLFANVTRRVAVGLFGGSRKISSRQRRLKAKRYK